MSLGRGNRRYLPRPTPTGAPLRRAYRRLGARYPRTVAVTTVAGFPAGGLGAVWLIWASKLGEVPVHALSKLAADIGWIA